MLGAIIGDICGSTYEFDNVKRKNIDLFPEGSKFTDDTVMTVAVAMALMDTMGCNAGDIKQAVIDSMKYFGHLYPGAGYGSRFYMWLRLNNPEAYNSYGNGSGMRASACGWLAESLEEALNLAQLSAEVTHNHPEGIKGAQAIAACIYLARAGRSKEEIRDYVIRTFEYDLDFTLDEIRPTYYHNETCQLSVPQAIEAFLESTDFEDAIRCAISVGGDSDTIADMTGAIAEAFYGGIPEEMKEKALTYLPDTLRYVVDRFYSIAVKHINEQFVYCFFPNGTLKCRESLLGEYKKLKQEYEDGTITNENAKRLFDTVIKGKKDVE